MMKTLCVAVVVLSLTSVCQPASLACQKLLKSLDKGPDLSGTWYVIAVSSDDCLVTTLLNSVFWPSIELDVTAKGLPNVYNANFKVKIHEHCTTESESFFYDNNTMVYVDSNNVLLQGGCPDCIVVKTDGDLTFLMLFSRRQTVTAAELKEFTTQTECLGWSMPQVLNSDHDYENCPSIDNNTDALGLSPQIYQRLKNSYTEPLKCLTENFLYYPRVAFEWVQQGVANLWPF